MADLLPAQVESLRKMFSGDIDDQSRNTLHQHLLTKGVSESDLLDVDPSYRPKPPSLGFGDFFETAVNVAGNVLYGGGGGDPAASAGQNTVPLTGTQAKEDPLGAAVGVGVQALVPAIPPAATATINKMTPAITASMRKLRGVSATIMDAFRDADIVISSVKNIKPGAKRVSQMLRRSDADRISDKHFNKFPVRTSGKRTGKFATEDLSEVHISGGRKLSKADRGRVAEAIEKKAAAKAAAKAKRKLAGNITSKKLKTEFATGKFARELEKQTGKKLPKKVKSIDVLETLARESKRKAAKKAAAAAAKKKAAQNVDPPSTNAGDVFRGDL